MKNIKEDEKLSVLNHSCAHLLAQAVKHLYNDAKFWVGPVIEEGFYYDIDLNGKTLTEEDLPVIEKEMKKITKDGKRIVRHELTKEEALEKFKDDPYKIDLIERMDEDNNIISCYTQGDFTDLCRGPHVESVKELKHFKLLKVSGAYWKNDSKNHMLQRIYGVCFETEEDLNEYLNELEERKQRDHRKIGKDLDIFMSNDLVGKGMPMWLPNGALIRKQLENYIYEKEQKLGYQHVYTPCVGTVDLYKTSGHWDHYKDGMFIIGDEEKDDEVFALRPMTCPFQYQAFLNRGRSYRDLPMRLNETSTLFRNEASGEMHGLIRVRQFTISEGHLMCTPDQLEDEFRGCLELTNYFLKTLGLAEDVSYRFSQWDPDNREKYMGTEEQWNEAQTIMKNILDDIGIDYKIGIGEAAFYGPKLDIQIKNVFGKEDTLITIQIDQMLAEKFGMEYVDRDGTKKNPYIIHRTSIGCYERTLAYLIEKYAGAFPTWLAPVQVKFLPIADRHQDYAREIMSKLQSAGIRCEIDDRSEKVGFKIRAAQMEKVPYMILVGDKDIEANTISVRSRKGGDEGATTVEEFLKRITEEVENKVLNY